MILRRIKNRLFSAYTALWLNQPLYKTKHLEAFFKEYINSGARSSLDLGSGPLPRNPFSAEIFKGVDIRSFEQNNVVYGNIASGVLPFESCSVDYVTAYDVLEHIPRVVVSSDGEQSFPLIMLMNEVFRILKPGGILFNIQPCYPMKEAFQDPTHINIMTEDTINLYFCERAWARIYGYNGSFTMLKQGWVGYKYFSFIRKSHDKPIDDLNFIQK